MCRLADGNDENARERAQVVEVVAHLQNAALIVELAAEGALHAALLQRVQENLPRSGAHLALRAISACVFLERLHARNYTAGIARGPITSRTHRSEEHTSELQSLMHLVCRLLLE